MLSAPSALRLVGSSEPPPSVFPDSVLPRLEAVADLFEQAGDTKTASGFREVIAVQRSLNAASREKAVLAVFLDDSVSLSQRETIEATLTQAEGVISVVYESKADAFEHFKEMFADYPELVANVSADALPASFRLRISGPEAFDQVASLAGSMPGVIEVTTDLSGVANLPPASFGVTSRALAQCKSPGAFPSP